MDFFFKGYKQVRVSNYSVVANYHNFFKLPGNDHDSPLFLHVCPGLSGCSAESPVSQEAPPSQAKRDGWTPSGSSLPAYEWRHSNHKLSSPYEYGPFGLCFLPCFLVLCWQYQVLVQARNSRTGPFRIYLPQWFWSTMKNVCKHIYALIRVSIANTKTSTGNHSFSLGLFLLDFIFTHPFVRNRISKISFFDDSILNIHFR